VGEIVLRPHAVETAKQAETQPARPVVVGLDGGYVRSRHRQDERHFEVIAGKLIDAAGTQHRFAFVRNGQAASAEAFTQALAAAGVYADTPATVLCEGDAGLWRLQRETLPAATVVLDWSHLAVRFEHVLQAARVRPTRTARALDRVPTQTRWPIPLDQAQTRARGHWHLPSSLLNHCAVAGQRAQPLAGPAPAKGRADRPVKKSPPQGETAGPVYRGWSGSKNRNDGSIASK
jgi:hypothetical protein